MDGAFHSAQVCVSEVWKGVAGRRWHAGREMEGSVVAARVVVASDGGGGEGVGATAGKQAHHAFSLATHEAVLK